MSNPKTEPTDNTQKNPDQWVSGDDPTNRCTASRRASQMRFNENLTKAEASKLIDEMRAKANAA